MEYMATISADWKITLPDAVLKDLDLKEGDLVAFFERDGNVYIINPEPGKANKQYQIVKRGENIQKTTGDKASGE